jgi:hypothetical protein
MGIGERPFDLLRLRSATAAQGQKNCERQAVIRTTNPEEARSWKEKGEAGRKREKLEGKGRSWKEKNTAP